MYKCLADGEALVIAACAAVVFGDESVAFGNALRSLREPERVALA